MQLDQMTLLNQSKATIQKAETASDFTSSKGKSQVNIPTDGSRYTKPSDTVRKLLDPSKAHEYGHRINILLDFDHDEQAQNFSGSTMRSMPGKFQDDGDPVDDDEDTDF